jgi:hypothetical protein
MAEPASLSRPTADQRLSRLRALCAAMENALAALATADSRRIERAVQEEKAACDGLRDLSCASIEGSASQAIGSPEILAAEQRLLHLNRVQAAYLRRAQRTLNIFSRLLALAPTYSPPVMQSAPGEK